MLSGKAATVGSNAIASNKIVTPPLFCVAG